MADKRNMVMTTPTIVRADSFIRTPSLERDIRLFDLCLCCCACPIGPCFAKAWYHAGGQDGLFAAGRERQNGFRLGKFMQMVDRNPASNTHDFEQLPSGSSLYIRNLFCQKQKKGRHPICPPLPRRVGLDSPDSRNKI